MRTLAQILLVILFIPIFLIGVLAINIKFQVLEVNFWQNTFRTNDVYTKLATASKGVLENQTVKEGGSLPEAKVLTNLVTPKNLRDFIEKNLVNILDYANGKVKNAMVYIPIKILPKDLLPANLGKISEIMPLSELLTELNVQGVQSAQIESISRFGTLSTYLELIDSVFLILILVLLFIMVGAGKHFVAPGVALIISGILTLVLSLLGNFINGSISTGWSKSIEPVQIILSSFAPYVLQEIFRLWFMIGIFALTGGIVILFFKKG